MVENIHIRAFQENEWRDFREKRLQALKEHQGLFLARYDEAAAKPDLFWIDIIASPTRRIFGLFDGKRLIGITGVFAHRDDPLGETAHLGMSYIDPEYRGLGLSRLLYQARIDWARGKGFKKITVGHREGNEASKAANQKFGFIFVEKEEIEFPDGRAFDCRYELKL